MLVADGSKSVGMPIVVLPESNCLQPPLLGIPENGSTTTRGPCELRLDWAEEKMTQCCELFGYRALAPGENSK